MNKNNKQKNNFKIQNVYDITEFVLDMVLGVRFSNAHVLAKKN